MLTQQQYKNKPKIAKLPKKERENRWRQYLASQNNRPKQFRATPDRRAYKNFQVKTADAESKLVHYFPPCAIHYLQALKHPFGLMASPCIPDLHSIPSKKVKVLSKYNFSTGVNGWGYVIAAPWCNSNDGTVAIATTAAYALAETIQTAGAAGTAPLTAAKLPYASTQFESVAKAPGVQARTVGFGIRVRYIGPQINRSGQLICLRHPDNETMIGLTSDGIKSYEQTVVFPVTKHWAYVHYNPVRPKEYEYSDYPCTASDASNYRWPITIIASGTVSGAGVAGPAPFELEIVQFVEYTGNIDNITRSHTDVTAMSHIRNALHTAAATMNPALGLNTSVHTIVKDIEKYGAPAVAGGLVVNHAKNYFAGETVAGTAEAEAASGGFFESLAAGATALYEGAAAYGPEIAESLMIL